VYVYATAISGNAEVADRVGASIRERYPEYKLVLEHTEDPDYVPNIS
jgi:hypothetical protein